MPRLCAAMAVGPTGDGAVGAVALPDTTTTATTTRRTHVSLFCPAPSPPSPLPFGKNPCFAPKPPPTPLSVTAPPMLRPRCAPRRMSRSRWRRRGWRDSRWGGAVCGGGARTSLCFACALKSTQHLRGWEGWERWKVWANMAAPGLGTGARLAAVPCHDDGRTVGRNDPGTGPGPHRLLARRLAAAA